MARSGPLNLQAPTTAERAAGEFARKISPAEQEFGRNFTGAGRMTNTTGIASAAGTVVDTTVGTVAKVGGMAGQITAYTMILSMLSGVAAIPGRAIRFVAGKIDTLAGLGTTPFNAAEGNILTRTAAQVGNFVAKLAQPFAKLAGKAQDAGITTKAANAGTTISNAAGHLATPQQMLYSNSVGSLETAASRFSTWLSRVFGNGAGGLRDRIATALSGASTRIKPVEARVASTVASAVQTVADKASGGLAAVADRITSRVASGNIISGVQGATSQSTTSFLQQKIQASAANKLQNAASTVKAIPQTISNMSVGQALTVTAAGTATAISTYSMARGFNQQLHSLKQMHHDVTGKEISTFTALFGSVPEEVKAARRGLWTSFLPNALLNVGGAAAYLKMSVGSGSKMASIASFALPMLSMGLNAITGKSDMLSAYSTLSNFAASKADVTPEIAAAMAPAYAEFIGNISPDAKKSGGAENEHVQAIAAQAAALKLTPKNIIDAHRNGNLEKAAQAALDGNADALKSALLGGTAVIGTNTARIVSNRAPQPLAPAADTGFVAAQETRRAAGVGAQIGA